MITTVADIPCRAIITHCSGHYRPAITQADPDNCCEAEYPDIEFEVLDLRGRPAPWLARKLTSAESHRIESELLNELY